MRGQDARRQGGVRAISSLHPSGIPDIELPYGPPPSALRTMEPETPVAAALGRRVRALSNNANRVRHKSPLVSAQCWHESGRLLERYGRRYAKAWVCYSRALALFPDLKPSLTGLLRLARTARDDAGAERLIAAILERAPDPLEKAALLCQSAVIKLRRGAIAEAHADLIRARSEAPGAQMPTVLLSLSLFSSASPDPHDARLRALADAVGAPGLSTGLRTVADRIADASPTGRLTDTARRTALQIDWIHVRHCLETRRLDEALGAVSRMRRLNRDGLLDTALSRLTAILSLVSGVSRPTEGAAADPIRDWLEAIVAPGSAPFASDALRALQHRAATPALRAALERLGRLYRWRPGAVHTYPADDPSLSLSANSAIRSFIRMGSASEKRTPALTATDLFIALSAGDWREVADQLSLLGQTTTDEAASWALFAAAAAIHTEHLGADAATLRAMAVGTGTPHQAPIPTLLRRLTGHPRGRAEIALAEAAESNDPQFRAIRLAFAAHHLESSDPFEAARYYSEALSLDPSLIFAVNGLGRTGTAVADLAPLYEAAAEKTGPGGDQGEAYLRAAVAYYATHAIEKAADALCNAAMRLPEEKGLEYVALVFSARASRSLVEAVNGLFAREKPRHFSPAVLGSLALFTAPDRAQRFFEQAVIQEPADPVIALGYVEAHFKAGRPSPVSGQLLERLQRTRDVASRAAVFQRLAHIDRFIRRDPASAVRAALELADIYPGHRPSWAQAAVHYLTRRRGGDARRALVSLSLAITDPEESRALSRLCTLYEPGRVDLLRREAAEGRATLLELAALETWTADSEAHAACLEAILERMPTLSAYRSRLADAYSRVGQDEEAVTLYKQSMDAPIAVLHNLHALTRCLRALGNLSLLVDTLVIQSDHWTFPRRRADTLFGAARLLLEQLDDPERARGMCMLALSADPSHEAAFEFGDRLFAAAPGGETERVVLMETRLQGVTDPMARLILHLKIGDLAGRLQDEKSKEKRRMHQREVIAIVINACPGFDDALTATDQAVASAAWLESVDEAIEHHRFAHDPMDDVDIYTAIGDNIVTFMDDPIRAEHYFEKALEIDASNPAALRFMAELRQREGRAAEAAAFLQRLLAVTSDDAAKFDVAMRLSETLLRDLGDQEGAEQVLTAATQYGPLDLTPLERLAALYDEQGDTFALSVHLDTALSRHAKAIAATPDDAALYRNIISLMQMRETPFLEALAADMLDGLADTPGAPRATWSFSPAIGGGAVDPYLCPKAISQPLRDTVDALFEPLSTLTGAASALNAAERVRRRHPLGAAVSDLAPLYGLKDVGCHTADVSRIHVISGHAPSLVFPRRILDGREPALRFAAAYALHTLHLGLGMATLVPLNKLRLWLAGFVRAVAPTFSAPGLDAAAVEAHAADITHFLSEEVRGALAPHHRAVADAVARSDLGPLLEAPGHRAGFFAAGSLRDALEGMAAVTPGGQGGARGSLLSFVFSRDHLLVRKRVGHA